MEKVIVMRPGVTAELQEWESVTLEKMQEVVQGWIATALWLPSETGSVHCYCNEEGRLQDFADNWTRYDGVVIVGPTIFVGETPDGESRGLTEAEIRLIRTHEESPLRGKRIVTVEGTVLI